MADGAAESTTLSRLKRVAELVGIVGGMGAALTALAFGIGYVATKQHDEMLGVPTTTTDHTTYVRTGALFFSQSLHDMVAAVAAAIPSWQRLAIVTIGIFLTLWIAAWIARTVRGASWQRWAVNLTLLLVLLVGLVDLPKYLAPLDPGNKNLLFDQLEVIGPAKEVNGYLRGENGERELHLLYGRQWATVLGMLLVVTWMRRWRAKIAAEAEGPSALGMIDRTLAPAALAVIGILVITTPSVYGVIAMDTSFPCVQLYKPRPGGDPTTLGEPGFLFSDLSSESAKIALLRWDTEKKTYFVDFHPRDSLVQLQVRYCPVRNPIQRQPTGKRGGS